MAAYEVEMHSEPGMWTYYRFSVRVNADNHEHAIDAARAKVKREAFPERPLNSWVIDDVRCAG